MKTALFIFLQYIAPQHGLSRVAGWLADTKITWIKNLLITRFVRTFNVDMEEAAESDPTAYENFNTFFCRPLKEGARPIEKNAAALVSPADGAVSQRGNIHHGRIFQAKGQDYSAAELLGEKTLAEVFHDGDFATIYLSPKDYHRLHMPTAGTLVSMTHIPGKLFSVNPATTENVPRLFARNERAVCVFETEKGPVALVLVGAMIVASIETVWAGLVAPAGKSISTTRYNETPPSFQQGEEFARFKLGSTIIILGAKDTIDWLPSFDTEAPVKMGQPIANLNQKSS